MSEDDFTKGNYTAYAVPPAQSEGSAIYLHDDIEKLKGKWYGAMEIFETPGATLEKHVKAFQRKDAEMGDFCKWLRERYKLVWKDNDFFFDHEHGVLMDTGTGKTRPAPVDGEKT